MPYLQYSESDGKPQPYGLKAFYTTGWPKK